jgi:hypothetical protein
MARDHFILPVVPEEPPQAVRMGAGNLEANRWDGKEVGKFAKLAGESRYDLCAVGNPIEAVVWAVELAPQNGYSIGSVQKKGAINVTFDGLQATPGTGVVAIGDYVVAGTVTAKGTELPGYPKVCKATAAADALSFLWRVVSLGAAGTGAVGTTGVIERV